MFGMKNLWGTLILSSLLLAACSETDRSPSEAAAESTGVQTADTLAMPAPERREVPRPTAEVPAGVSRITWQTLTDVEFEEKYYDEIQQMLLFPNFGQTVQDLEGDRVAISGYVIPVDPGGPDRPARYVLSANPFSACFFCGAAGPESVVELELTDPDLLFATDEFRSFSGVFRLNDSDYDKLNYILQDAELL